MWCSRNCYDIHDCPDPVTYVPKGIEEEHTVLHGDIIYVPRPQVDRKSHKYSWPHYEHKEVDNVLFGVNRAVLLLCELTRQHH